MTSPVTATETDTHVLLAMDDGKANAMSFAMFEGLNHGLDLAAGAGKMAVIAGRAGRFSAGFDLTVMGQGGGETLRLLREGADLSARLMAFDTPVVAAVSGHALAMGALLCLSVDYRIGIRGDYKIGLNEVAIGMTLPWFGVELARARLAKDQFNRAVGLAWIYDAPAAVEAGFLDEAVDADALEARVAAVSQGLAALDFKAHRNTKARVRGAFFSNYEAALQRDFEEGEILA
jgi:enoyl-CoA hydratase